MQFAGASFHGSDSFAQFWQAGRFEILHHLRRHHLGNHQLAHQVDQPIDFVSRYAYGARLGCGSGLFRGSPFLCLAPLRLLSPIGGLDLFGNSGGYDIEGPRLSAGRCRANPFSGRKG